MAVEPSPPFGALLRHYRLTASLSQQAVTEWGGQRRIGSVRGDMSGEAGDG
jgi:hypothetical protein